MRRLKKHIVTIVTIIGIISIGEITTYATEITNNGTRGSVIEYLKHGENEFREFSREDAVIDNSIISYRNIKYSSIIKGVSRDLETIVGQRINNVNIINSNNIEINTINNKRYIYNIDDGNKVETKNLELKIDKKLKEIYDKYIDDPARFRKQLIDVNGSEIIYRFQVIYENGGSVSVGYINQDGKILNKENLYEVNYGNTVDEIPNKDIVIEYDINSSELKVFDYNGNALASKKIEFGDGGNRLEIFSGKMNLSNYFYVCDNGDFYKFEYNNGKIVLKEVYREFLSGPNINNSYNIDKDGELWSTSENSNYIFINKNINGKCSEVLKINPADLKTESNNIQKNLFVYDKDDIQIALINKVNGMDKYFDLKSSWIKNDGKWIYKNIEGVKCIGWNKIDGKWYKFDKDGVMESAKWIKSGEVYYYLSDSGEMAENCWKEVNKRWYKFDKNGVMESAKWIKSGEIYYYLNNSGEMVENCWKEIDNNWYKFDKSGVMITNKIIDGWKISSNGVAKKM